LFEYYAARAVNFGPNSCHEILKPLFWIIHTLVENPVFMKDQRAVTAIEKLANLDPKSKNPLFHARYVYKGFGAEHIPVFTALANSEAIWNGSNDSNKSSYMATIGEGLRCIAARDPSLLPETVLPRVAIMDMNNRTVKNHNPLRKAVFLEREVAIIDRLYEVAGKNEHLMELFHGSVHTYHYMYRDHLEK